MNGRTYNQVTVFRMCSFKAESGCSALKYLGHVNVRQHTFNAVGQRRSLFCFDFVHYGKVRSGYHQ